MAVLDAKDKNGLQIIAAISPTNKKDGYHFIASFYGKSALQNMINKANEIGNIKYIKDKSQISAGEVQYFPITLTGSLNGNILQKSDIVNGTYYQFAGEKAQTAALDQLEQAKQLEAAGTDNEQMVVFMLRITDRQRNK